MSRDIVTGVFPPKSQKQEQNKIERKCAWPGRAPYTVNPHFPEALTALFATSTREEHRNSHKSLGRKEYRENHIKLKKKKIKENVKNKAEARFFFSPIAARSTLQPLGYCDIPHTVASSPIVASTITRISDCSTVHSADGTFHLPLMLAYLCPRGQPVVAYQYPSSTRFGDSDYLRVCMSTFDVLD